MFFTNRLSRFLAACALAGSFTLAAQAQEEAPTTSQRPLAAASRRLPADATSEQTLVLPGRTLSFKATAGTIKLTDERGAEQADIAYVAYQLDGAPAQSRPVTFVFNGGPGAASVWLHLGALGPWRLPMVAGATHPSASPVLVDNDDTWLDFTDLVFIDPAGTGYSQIVATGEEARKRLWSVDGDIDALAVVVRRWLAANDRLTSPKFIVGESYGGFRGPRLARALATEQGVGISGLVLISPALDFATVTNANEPFSSAILLPSYAAAAREKNGPVTRDQLADVEQYASGDYLADYLRGPRDAAAVARMVDHVSALTGLDPALVRRLGGRIDKETFLREFDRADRKVGADYDATITAYDPAPTSNRSRWLDPALDASSAPLASAMMDLYAHRLGWKIDNRYEPLSSRVNHGWDWGGELHPPESIQPLREMLALDPNFRVLVTHGLTDLQLPYYGTKLLLDQIPDYGAPGRLTLKVYGGGHMHYMRDDSRKALREDARKLIEGK
ncbi:S10 family peptidase [Methylocapsa sp. S129]|uniref:S10 family peptidase n=1 Tax=Methylocapsa sp. S129 TaxID=1641869 RepID=UPI00131B3391|nr:peptidase S10 [Methylocapsa sp. S129]